jgi:MHS family shikimate/dehydroshikimate transporter-like MFS transporter
MAVPLASDAHVDPTMKSIRPVILASFIGTMIEWYDFFIYGTAAALVFNKLFFPTFDPFVGTLSSFATFAVGFVARPVGGIVFGHFGDRLGRKSMLVWALLIMGVATFITGLLPTYATAGVWAPTLLVLMRMAQGIGLGGEWGGAVLMAVEHAPKNRRGLAGSMPQMGALAGLLLSTLVFTVITRNMTDEQFLAWGWRLPFLMSIVLIGVGTFIRLNIAESPAFTKLKDRNRVDEAPLVAVMRDYRKNTLLAIGMRFAENGLFYIYTVFVLTYSQVHLGVPRATMLTGVTIGAAIGCFSVPFFGHLSDRFGRRRVYMFGALFSLAFAFPFFALLGTKSPLLMYLAVFLGLNVGHDAMYGPQGAYFSELFGTRVRYSGASLAYQLSSVFAGGLAPLIATALLASWGTTAVAGYMTVLSAITVVSTYFAPETYKDDVS